jgi:hypothetical protein
VLYFCRVFLRTGLYEVGVFFIATGHWALVVVPSVPIALAPGLHKKRLLVRSIFFLFGCLMSRGGGGGARRKGSGGGCGGRSSGLGLTGKACSEENRSLRNRVHGAKRDSFLKERNTRKVPARLK